MSFDFVIEKISSESVEEAANLMVTTFNAHEPLAIVNTAPPQEFADFILYLTEKSSEQGLGFVAKEATTNKVIGAVLSSDLAESVNSNDDEQDNPIAALIGQLNRLYFKEQQLPEGTYLNIKFVAMDSGFKGKGVVLDLISTCINEAKHKGYKYAQAEATGNISQHIFNNKLGFDEKALIKYNEFSFAGQKPFSAITEHEGIKLFVKEI